MSSTRPARVVEALDLHPVAVRVAQEGLASGEGNVAARAHWTSRLGFILAAAGSAVGLGNIWKFPYMTGENGGGAFVLVYLLCVPGVGLPIVSPEGLVAASPDEVMILTWDIADEVIAQLRSMGLAEARFFVPLPRLREGG